MPLSHTTLQAAALAVFAGSLTSISLAQESKEQPKPDSRIAGPAPRAAAAAGQPKANGKDAPAPRAAAAQPPKAGNPAPAPTTPGAGQPPAAQTPGDEPLPAAVNTNYPPPPEGWFRFDAFAEPVDVRLLVDLVADRLKIQIISTEAALRDKKIQLFTPIDVPEDKLLDFLSLLLEQNGQYIKKEAIGFYVIDAQSTVGSSAPGGDFATTQVVPTRGLKPSGLSLAIAQVLKGGAGAGGQPGMPQQNVLPNIAYLDDLGVLVITDTPRRIGAVKGLIEQLSNEQINLEFSRFEVRHLSASIAKQRMLELLGQVQRTTGGTTGFNPNDPNAMAQANAAMNASGVNSSNLAVRIIPDPQSNALTLRGRPEEVELITRLLEVVDVPNQLIPKWYAVGPAAQALAEQGKRAGLGDVTVMQSTRGGNTQNPGIAGGGFFPDENGFPNTNNRFGSNNQTASGPVFVLDADQRGFIYYGTNDQHVQLDKLVKEFGEITQSERVVYEFYKLKFVDATKTSELIRGMINNTVPGGESPLVPGAGGTTGGRRNNSVGASLAASAGEEGGGDDAIIATADVHVLPDVSNNQVVIKAPQRLQPQFARLINKIDLRRPQVYIDAKIIVVTNREDFQLSVETQLINANGAGGALRTLFPGSPATVGNILTPPVIGASQGIVAAVIKSDQVPVIINALAQSRSGRIVASPQLLVDDNEEATITSINQEPTTTTTVGTGTSPPTTSFAQYVEAGPKLTVKPRLSTGDLLSMEYEVELSSFTGAGSAGVPPPKITNNIKSKSVTIPSDSTIVVGGLEFSQKSTTVFKVPFLGDIPIIGEAFKSTTNVDDKRTVYVFITPRIMRDPIGNDLRYISEGPSRRAGNDSELPPVRVELIEIHPTTGSGIHVPVVPPPSALPPSEPAAAPVPEPTQAPN
ncbi:MAG: secretin N-terminal domain-containing protein [Phycisphaerales bacterium]|nr:secretin N-terminal domain-containing protein [Phycisphaerales bacterium]